MSIILKGIDLPEKENRMYMMELYANGHCSVAKIEDGECYELTIPSETEAIQIPKNHGRLIDADKLRAILRRWTEDEWNQKASPVSWAYAYEDLIDLIDDAPTILEAEE